MRIIILKVLTKDIVQDGARGLAGTFAGALDHQRVGVECTAHDDGVLRAPQVVCGVLRSHAPYADTSFICLAVFP